MTQTVDAYVWEYRVRPEADAGFREHYGPDGHWVRLFRRAAGYIGTELYQDRKEPRRYLTIDHWESLDAYDRFRQRFAAEFDAMDRRCEAFTESESELGTFSTVPGSEAGN